MKGEFKKGIASRILIVLAFMVLSLLTWNACLQGGLWADDPLFLLFAREAPLLGLLNIWILKLEFARDYWMQFIAFTQGVDLDSAGGLAMYWRPVTNLITALDARIWGNQHWGYHLTNLAVHTASAILFWRVLQKLGLRSRWALFSALVWLVLPSHTFTISWISARHDLFAAFFALLCINSYLNWYKQPECKRHIWLGVLFYLLALGSKATIIFIPFLIPLHTFLFGRHLQNSTDEKLARRHSLKKTSLYWFAPLAAIGAAMFLLKTNWPLPEGAFRITSRYFLNMTDGNPLLMFTLPLQYLFQVMFGLPPLSFDTIPWPTFILPSCMVLWVLLTFLLFHFRHNKIFVFGAAWFLLAFTPLMYVAVGSHYIYCASFGVVVAFAGILQDVLPATEKWKNWLAVAVALYMMVFWCSSASLATAWYTLVPKTTENLFENLKAEMPELVNKHGKPYRKVYILNAWSQIHHLGYLFRFNYKVLETPVRILTIDPGYFPHDLDLSYDPRLAILHPWISPYTSKSNVFYKRIDEHTLDVSIKDGAFLQSVMEKKVLLEDRKLEAFRTYTLDGGLEESDGFTSKIIEVDSSLRPTKFRFKFQHELDDEHVLYLLEQGSRFVKLDFSKISTRQDLTSQ